MVFPRVLGSLVVFLVAATASAQTRTYRDWTVVISDDKQDLIAATGVDNDKYLAYRCFGKTGKCVHVFNLAAECQDGKSYPVLVNSSYSALAMTCACSKNGHRYELVPDFDQFHKILESSTGYIGLALPMVSGQFKVVRFSLAGVRDAMALAERAATRDSAEYH